MQLNFEEIISGFLEKRIGISNSFLSADLALHMKANLLAHYEKDALTLAGVGNNRLLSRDKKNRSDKIFWLNPADNNPHEKVFFELIDSFVCYLNSTCFTGILSHEFHYALYEAGAYYTKHIDQFKSDDSRAFSLIMYLNEAWSAQDGGELKVYHETAIQLIAPQNQKCIFFKSNEMAHEVLLTHVPRMSITGWLKTSL